MQGNLEPVSEMNYGYFQESGTCLLLMNTDAFLVVYQSVAREMCLFCYILPLFSFYSSGLCGNVGT